MTTATVRDSILTDVASFGAILIAVLISAAQLAMFLQ